MRPFGVQVVVYPRRASLHHLEERGIREILWVLGTVPAWIGSITRGTGATIRQYRHIVTPLICLEMHAALMHCVSRQL